MSVDKHYSHVKYIEHKRRDVQIESETKKKNEICRNDLINPEMSNFVLFFTMFVSEIKNFN